ncbi:hypothetical protein ASE00_08560 [Sphingomonas sp. Root710]|uniref:putative entry exclusion protein TrbK-alt n=1 Tax=Sphingomonas sp. Root710 TaxID=1736594 RepID=UPI0007006A15|nr:putative entry exclusion protein TrbK-alt [Sphingomonas sp. Root710]KRB86721.1 hypothetical protein ASE00_08560 [Sphingomonas sp. Root710]
MTEEEQPAKPRRRFAALGWRSAAIAAAAATTGVAVLITLSGAQPPAAHYRVGDTTGEPAKPNVDPLLAELTRCRTLPADTDDARCRAAWEVNRRRFMGESRSLVVPVEPAPIEPAPANPLTVPAGAGAPSTTWEH